MIHLLVYLFIAFAWSRALLQFKAKTITFWEFLFWSALWAGAAVVIYMPGLTGEIAIKIGIGRGADVVVYSSIILLFYLLFRVYIKVSLTEREMTRLVREIAIKDSAKLDKKVSHN